MTRALLPFPLWLVSAGCPVVAERADTDKVDDSGAETDSVEIEDTGETGNSAETGDTVETGDTGDTACDLQTFWVDADADGFGHIGFSLDLCEQPPGYADNAEDCDDNAVAVNPAATEVCDSLDNDCDTTVDIGAADAPIWYQDQDRDGVGSDAATLVSCSAPDGYVATGGDCYDLDSATTTGETWFLDDDGDGWGAEPVVACEQPAGSLETDGDCDDAVAEISPDAPELCDGLDDDCDLDIDEDATDLLTWYADHDGDGYGTEADATLGCEPPAGYVELATDCDDSSTLFSPGATETCSGLDEDCDGLVDADDPDMSGVAIWYLDEDGDGHGVPSTSVSDCAQPAGYALDADDCDDADAMAFPGADETCDETDEDCDGSVDDSAIDAANWYVDVDGDGFGDAALVWVQCAQPASYVENAGDCDDGDWDVSPDGIEVCDGIDQDCDGSIDEQLWYADADADGYGDPEVVDTTCAMPSGFVADWTDCDDLTPDVSPAGVEVCGGADEDCDGFTDDADSGVTGTLTWFVDGDLDGWGAGGATTACVAPTGSVDREGDCDDSKGDISPDGVEVCGGADEDCDTLTDDADTAVSGTREWYLDADGDGFGGSVATEACLEPSGYAGSDDDCDDGDVASYPVATEVRWDDIDQDCDGLDAPADYATDWGSEMIAIRAGSFTMGGGVGDPDATYTDHVVTLTHDFWIGQTEITQGQWESFGANAGWPFNSNTCTTSTTTADCPADSISWYDVAKYCNALSAQEGLSACYLVDGTDLDAAFLADPYACPGYRMPTEAEWEYAARAGDDTEFSGSDTPGGVAWYEANAYALGTSAHQVATLAPNSWGLYDMSGNLWEWTNDWYSYNYGGYGNGAAQTDPSGPTSGSDRVDRGGNWDASASFLRVARRDGKPPVDPRYYVGARLSRSIP